MPRVPYQLVHGQVAGGIVYGLVVSGPRHVNAFWVFDLQHGVPHDRSLVGNRPPRVVHMTLYTGNLGQALGGMAYPRTRRNATLGDDIVAATHSPLLFGPVTWAGRKGALFLAPSYPTGGEIGGHLAFWWRAQGNNYLISIHAWKPLIECKSVLRTIVTSTPTS